MKVEEPMSSKPVVKVEMACLEKKKQSWEVPEMDSSLILEDAWSLKTSDLLVVEAKPVDQEEGEQILC